jgi:antirestriction protein ArdC
MRDPTAFQAALNSRYALDIREPWLHFSNVRVAIRALGSESYAMEEVIAELSAAFASAQLGLARAAYHNAPYIAPWLKVLKNDSRAICSAASKAQAAADYLAGYSLNA